MTDAADLQRRPHEPRAAWANRCRKRRAALCTTQAERDRLDALEWFEGPGGNLQLRPVAHPQSKLDLEL